MDIGDSRFLDMIDESLTLKCGTEENFMKRDKVPDLIKLTRAFFEHLIIDGGEFGGIGLDSKRPFGNSGAVTDILEIIEMEPEYNCPDCGKAYSEEQYRYARDLYFKELIPFLQKSVKKCFVKS